MSGIFDEFGGSLTADVISFDRDAIPAPDTLVIRMKRGERRIADELRKLFGGFKRVVVDVDGEQHEFGADSLIRMLESYEQVPEQGERENDGERESYGSRWHELFGTTERAARTLLDVCDNCGQDDCNGCQVYELTSGGDLDYDSLLEWLRGDA